MTTSRATDTKENCAAVTELATVTSALARQVGAVPPATANCQMTLVTHPTSPIKKFVPGMESACAECVAVRAQKMSGTRVSSVKNVR